MRRYRNQIGAWVRAIGLFCTSLLVTCATILPELAAQEQPVAPYVVASVVSSPAKRTARTAIASGQKKPAKTDKKRKGSSSEVMVLRYPAGEARPMLGSSVAELQRSVDRVESNFSEIGGALPEDMGARLTPTPDSATRPWIQVYELEPFGTDPFRLEPTVNTPTWKLFQPESRYASQGSTSPNFLVTAPRKTEFAQAFDRILSRKYNSEVRRFFKRSWRRQFYAQPTMSYATYLQGLTKINQLGRDPFYDDGNSEHFSNELRDDFFGRAGREGEGDFEIFNYGPFVVMDSGSIRLDLGRAIDLNLFDSNPKHVIGGPGSRPIVSTKSYSISTSVRLGFDPIEAARSVDPTWLIDRYGVQVQVHWLTGVLGRKGVSTAVELEAERNGDFAALFNFVVHSR